MSEGGLTAGVSIRRLELETPDTGFWEVMNLSGRVTCISSMCHTGIPTSGFATIGPNDLMLGQIMRNPATSHGNLQCP
jgi:hypothetical protein